MSFLFAGGVGSSPNKIGREYSQMLRLLSLPKPEGDKFNFAIKRAADRAGLDYWRAFDIWYGKARRIDADEADRIRAAVQHKNEEEARNEYQELRTRLLKMESRLAAS